MGKACSKDAKAKYTHTSHNELIKKEVGSELYKLLNPYFKQRESLTTLHLEFKRFGDGGASAISKNTTWTNLITINLSYNSIGAEGANALSKNTTWTNLSVLDLSRNKIGAE